MKRKVWLIGIGMGSLGGMTGEARAQIEKSDLLIGAERMIRVFRDVPVEKLISYRAEEIGLFLRTHTEFCMISVLFSGDVGFYSGASSLLKELVDFEVVLLPGISSLVSFCSKLKITWENISFVSHHGREVNVVYRICHERKTFALLSGEKDFHSLCEKLILYGMNHIKLHIGENLSYPDERILHLLPSEALSYSFGNLLVLVAENETPREKQYQEIADDRWIRGKVPMTKSEVRTIILSKLRLHSDACFYDIGAGTGSVSIQAAMNFPDIKIFAIEKKEEAVQLIEANKLCFAADNVKIVKGIAPDCIAELPVPTHVFIGGSTGRMREILMKVWEKNPNVRIVVSVIALETMAEIVGILKETRREAEEVLQISVSKTRKIGEYHLLFGQNPVTILVF